jgi:hypothetical protein
MLIILACNGAVTIGAPQMTAVRMGSSHITAFWEEDESIESHPDFIGYNIYIYTDSSALLVNDGEELNKFNSQAIHDTTYQVSGLSQDSIYYVQVRTVNAENKVDGYNSALPFLKASPRPEFTVTMRLAAESQPANDSSAIRYRDALIMPDSLMADSAADMWARVSGDTIWFVSPDLHPVYGSGALQTFFYNMGPDDFYSTSVVTSEPGLEETEITAGDIIVARSEGGNYVKLYIDTVDLQNHVVTVLYAYQNIPGFPYF